MQSQLARNLEWTHKWTNPQDRPDLVARVFELYKKAVIDNLTKNNYFGQHIAIPWVIEFQKRGLPHVHILLVLDKESKQRTTEHVDAMVVEELPGDPNQEGLSKEQKEQLT